MIVELLFLDCSRPWASIAIIILVDRPKHRFEDVASFCGLGVDKITKQARE